MTCRNINTGIVGHMMMSASYSSIVCYSLGDIGVFSSPFTLPRVFPCSISFLVLPLQNLYKLVLDTYEEQERNCLHISIVWFESSPLKSKPLVPVRSSMSSRELPQYPRICLSNLLSIICHLLSLSNIVQHPSTLSPTTILNIWTLLNPANISSNYFEPLHDHFRQLRDHSNDFGHHLHYLGLSWWYLVPIHTLPLTHVMYTK